MFFFKGVIPNSAITGKITWIIKIVVALCLVFVSFPGHTFVIHFFQGQFQNLDTTIVNANSGEVVPIIGNYFVNTGNYIGSSAEPEDILSLTVESEFMVWEAGTPSTFESIDIIAGSSGSDVLDLSRITDSLLVFGGNGADLIWTGSGDDRLNGDPGNDILDGGLGIDTVEYQVGILTDFQIIQTAAGTYQFTHASQGVDVLTNIELVSFSDGSTYNLADLTATAVPEPSTFALLSLGLVAFGFASRKKQKT